MAFKGVNLERKSKKALQTRLYLYITISHEETSKDHVNNFLELVGSCTGGLGFKKSYASIKH